MESFNHPCANPGRRVHVRLVVVAAVLMLVIPGILAGQLPVNGSTRNDSAKASASSSTPLRLGTVYDELRKANPRIQAAEALTRAARSRISSAGLPPDPELQLGWMKPAPARVTAFKRDTPVASGLRKTRGHPRTRRGGMTALSVHACGETAVSTKSSSLEM